MIQIAPVVFKQNLKSKLLLIRQLPGSRDPPEFKILAADVGLAEET